MKMYADHTDLSKGVAMHTDSFIFPAAAIYAKIMHAKLIRTHTVATGADSCDYWYVPDYSDTAKSYTGRIG